MKRARDTIRRAAALALGAALLAGAADAGAAGLVLDARALPAETAEPLAREIARARGETPELFRAVASVVADANAIDARSRKRGMPLTMRFKALGPRAFFPMLEALAFDARPPRALAPSAARAVKLGLIEAIGIVRDPRAVPVLAKILHDDRDGSLTRASAEALARIGTDEAFAIVRREAARHAPGSERERAVLAGLHDCRREAAARYLAERLDQRPDDATARVVARSLGGVGNAWAWRALPSRAEQPAVTRIVTAALVRAYVAYGGEVREAVAKALLVVASPDAPAEIARARSAASGDAAIALDELATRIRAR